MLRLRYFLNLDRACLFVFNIKKIYIFGKRKSPFTPKSEMMKPQARCPRGTVFKSHSRQVIFRTHTLTRYIHLCSPAVKLDLLFAVNSR